MADIGRFADRVYHGKKVYRQMAEGKEVSIPPLGSDFRDCTLENILAAATPDHPVLIECDPRTGNVVAMRAGD